MVICGQTFRQETIARIITVISENPGITRSELSRQVCAWLNWKSDNGRLKEVSSRVSLLKLERAGLIKLPPVKKKPPRFSKTVVPVEKTPDISCEIFELGNIELVMIEEGDTEKSRTWNKMMDRYHYLGSGPICGSQIRYIVKSSIGGFVGGLSFSSPSISLECRDRWIGWNKEQRKKEIRKIICNSRFLMLPHLQIKHLASHVLGKAMKQIKTDWADRYGYEPLLIETFVDRDLYPGTSYQASNWIYVGHTKGRGRQDSKKEYGKSKKDVYLYPLKKDARAQLCGGVPAEGSGLPVDWVEAELSEVKLGDKRLNSRLMTITRDFYSRPAADIPEASRSRAGAKAAYRFFDNEETGMQAILEPHYESALRRIRKEKTVLVIQDTTSLNYSAHPATEGIGPIGSDKEKGYGLLVHDTLAFTTEGTPLGIIDVQAWARDKKEFGKRADRHNKPIEDKESNKWLVSYRKTIEAQKRCQNTRLINICDREGDIYELFHLALTTPDAPGLLVRAERDRLLSKEQEQITALDSEEQKREHLWEQLPKEKSSGEFEVSIPRRKKTPKRTAALGIRYKKVKLSPPRRKSGSEDIILYAILAEEKNAPEGIEPLKWMLLTTVPVESFADAREKIDWYCRRWGIEIYHKTMKSGCRIEERQLGSLDRIETCLAVDMIVAWRIYYLTKLGRETPDVPCTVFFEDAEWKVLVAHKTGDITRLEKPPTLREAIRMIASLGGFLGRKSDGEPGTKSLWLGLQYLDGMTIGWTAALSLHAPHLLTPSVVGTGYG